MFLRTRGGHRVAAPLRLRRRPTVEPRPVAWQGRAHALRARFRARRLSLPLPRVALVAIGGLVGSVVRYWLAGVVQDLTNHGFPTGTLAVNVLGSFVIGLVMVLSLERGLLDAELRVLLATGFCGGFTTMSTFSYETLALVRDGERLLALGNVGITLAACLGATWAGAVVARLI